MFSIYKLSYFFLLQTLTTTTTMNRTRTRSMHTYTKHHTCMCSCRCRRRCIVATFHFAHIFGCDSIGIEWTHTLTPDHLVYIGIFCRWLYCVDNRKFAYTNGYGKPKPATTTACTTTTNTSSWVQWAISVQTRSVYTRTHTPLQHWFVKCLVFRCCCSILSDAGVVAVCAKYAHTQASRVYLAFWFAILSVRTHAHTPVLSWNYRFFGAAVVALFIFVGSERVCGVRCMQLLFLRRKFEEDTHSSTQNTMQCISHFYESAQHTLFYMYKMQNLEMAWMLDCVTLCECALARIFSRPPKNELVYFVSKMIVFITWNCKRKLIENEMHEIWMERVLYLSCKRLSLTAC